ncbi:MAG TPA: hypothetical protein VJ085_02040 [Candidatus Acidoferrales bacterium]|nr:hypothetical protein [Candidatus Acidoferrales bacterium]
MAESNRTTVYLEPGLHRALKVKSATTDRSLSELVNEAVREALREDAADLRAFRRRRREPSRPLEDVIVDLKRDGLL